MKVILEAIQFNHQANSATNDAFNIRRNESDPLIGPEWQRGISVRPEDSPAAYARLEVGGNALIVKARFSSTNNAGSKVNVKALDGNNTAAGDPINVLGESSKTEVTLTSGSSGFVDFTFNNPSISQVGVGVTDITWRWVYSVEENPDTWIEFAVTHHRIYTALSIPKLPWSPESTNASDTQVPWTEVLDFACRWAAGAANTDDAATAITKKLNSLGSNGLVQYNDPNSGSQNFAHESPFAFDCTSFLQLLTQGGNPQGNEVNCDDCAAIVVTFANILGCDLREGRMGPPAFRLKEHLRIGLVAPTGVGTKFHYHTVAWKDDCDEDDQVFDGCLQLNSAAAGAPPVFFVPTNVLFGELGQQEYRFRLALKPENCRPKGIPRRRRIGLSAVTQSSSRFSEFVKLSVNNPFVSQFVVQNRDIADWNFAHHRFIETSDTLFQNESFWDNTHEAQAALVVNAFECDSPRSAFELLGSLLQTFQLDDIERTNLGDLGFANPSKFAILFVRDVFVFRFRNVGRTPAPAAEFAKFVDGLFIQLFQKLGGQYG